MEVPQPAANAHYLDIPSTKLLAVLDDPKKRVSDLFHVGDELKPIVGFWLRIYAKYSEYQTLIYDRNHPEVIYDVIDNREFFQRGLSPVAQDIMGRNRVKRAIADLVAAFRKLQKNPHAHFATGTAGANIVRLWGKKTAKQWREIARSIRSQPGQRDRIMDGITNADRFIPAMEAIFKKYGVPPEITRIPLVESSFNLQAVSKADAVGVWQFLEKSAAEYLVVDPYHKIDERLSPIKSAYAAARMFKRNYHILKDWGLSIIAYNHGVKNLIPIRKKYKGDRISTLLAKTSHTPLGYASRNYYAEFLALLHAERYRDELYGMAPQQHSDAISIVKMRRPASIFEISSLYNISIHELRVFNPDIFDLKRTLPAGTRVVLPRKHGESLVAAPKIAAPSGAPSEPTSRGIASEVEYIDYIH
jgi:membrane-bound lytic murein transglycosylase D